MGVRNYNALRKAGFAVVASVTASLAPLAAPSAQAADAPTGSTYSVIKMNSNATETGIVDGNNQPGHYARGTFMADFSAQLEGRVRADTPNQVIIIIDQNNHVVAVGNGKDNQIRPNPAGINAAIMDNRLNANSATICDQLSKFNPTSSPVDPSLPYDFYHITSDATNAGAASGKASDAPADSLSATVAKQMEKFDFNQTNKDKVLIIVDGDQRMLGVATAGKGAHLNGPAMQAAAKANATRSQACPKPAGLSGPGMYR